MRCKIIYSGRVQGVGFRWNVADVIASFALTGMVKNLDDGTVQVILEGKQNEINLGRDAIEERMKGYWVRNEIECQEEAPHFSEFSILR
jgi:acylphosphatase